MTASEPQQPLPLAELGPRGHYRIPPIVPVTGVVFSSTTQPIRIHLVLETGHVLDIPMTQAVLDDLYGALKSLATQS